MRRGGLAVICILVAGWSALAAAAARGGDSDTAAYIRANYTKFEYRIPMRDGVELFTAVYVPNDRSQRYPILLMRTPYAVGPYGADRYPDLLGPSPGYAREGFIFAYQDVRGRFMSEGEFVNMRPHLEHKGPTDVDESTDTWDTVDWLVKHVPGNNGKVGQWGISYPGFYTSAGIIDTHPALVAASPQAPIADWYWDDMHHNGAFILPLTFDFFAVFGQPREGLTTQWPERFDHGTPDGYDFFLRLGSLANANERYFHGKIPFWNEIVAHPDYDHFWQSRNLLPHLRNVRCAVMTVGGWFDTEDLYGPLHTYRAIEDGNPGTFNVLVMGPWTHGGWDWTDGDRLGSDDFGFKTSPWYREHVELPFFNHFLKGEGDLHQPEALVFETGANRWRSFDSWPPANLEQRSYYLAAEGGLDAAPAAPSAAGEAFDEYVSDPAKPVPYTMEITNHWAKKYMAEDQRFAAWRPDVLVYEGDELKRDLTIAGPITADLWVSTSGGDSDFIVKVIDVYPGDMPEGTDESGEPVELGETQRLVRAEVFRGRYRNSFEHPEPFAQGEVARVRFTLNDVLHTFPRGHRVMVQVQSTWFPFVDRNPGTWVPNIFAAEADDFVKVTNRIYRSAEHPSRVVVGVLKSEE